MRNRSLTRLNLTKKLALGGTGLAVLMMPIIIGTWTAPAGRAQEAKPQFEVTSVKPDTGCENVPRTIRSYTPSPERLEMPCMTLQSLMQAAFATFSDGVTINPQPLHAEGGPSWMRSERYSVSAKADGPHRAEMLAGPMLQRLLEERFRLKTHREMREIPVYAIAVEKGGIKAQPVPERGCTPVDLTDSQTPSPPPPRRGDPLPNLCGVMIMERTGKGDSIIEVRGSTVTQLAQRLSQLLDRTVVDKTGIAGKFNFHLEFTPDSNMPGQRALAGRGGDSADPGNPAQPRDPGPDLFMALQNQIGLKLSSDKGPISFLIIDHVEKPTPN